MIIFFYKKNIDIFMVILYLHYNVLINCNGKRIFKFLKHFLIHKMDLTK